MLKMVQNTEHLLASDGRFYAMKGKFPGSELRQLPIKYGVENIIKLAIPELHEDRYLIIIKNKKMVS